MLAIYGTVKTWVVQIGLTITCSLSARKFAIVSPLPIANKKRLK